MFLNSLEDFNYKLLEKAESMLYVSIATGAKLHNSFPRQAITRERKTTHPIMKCINEISYLKNWQLTHVSIQRKGTKYGYKLVTTINRNLYKTIENLKITWSVESINHVNKYTKDCSYKFIQVLTIFNNSFTFL